MLAGRAVATRPARFPAPPIPVIGTVGSGGTGSGRLRESLLPLLSRAGLAAGSEVVLQLVVREAVLFAQLPHGCENFRPIGLFFPFDLGFKPTLFCQKLVEISHCNSPYADSVSQPSVMNGLRTLHADPRVPFGGGIPTGARDCQHLFAKKFDFFFANSSSNPAAEKASSIRGFRTPVAFRATRNFHDAKACACESRTFQETLRARHSRMRFPEVRTPAQCASAQLSPWPTSTTSGTSIFTAGLAAPSITLRTHPATSSTAPSSTSKRSSS